MYISIDNQTNGKLRECYLKLFWSFGIFKPKEAKSWKRVRQENSNSFLLELNRIVCFTEMSTLVIFYSSRKEEQETSHERWCVWSGAHC